MTNMQSRQRADRLLVEKGFFESRARAQAAIAAGLVSADGVPVRKASDTISITAEFTASAPHPWVSRGGVKLAQALDHFSIPVEGRICLDVGASTGGFTHVLLERSAAFVHAIDVGHGQLHASLRDDPRILSREGCDIRTLDPALIEPKPDLAVIDVSFISLKHVLPAVLGLTEPSADIVALIKPQFEAPRAAIRKGIVRDENVHEAVCSDTMSFLSALGCTVQGIIASPIAGGDGNKEFLLRARRD